MSKWKGILYFFFCFALIQLSFNQHIFAENITVRSHLQRENPDTFSPFFILQFEDHLWTLNLKDVGFDGIDPTTLDRRTFFNWLYLVVEKEINRPPRSAYYDKKKMIPHQVGRTVDREQILDWLDQIHEYVNHPIQLPVIWTEPWLTTSKLKKLKELRLSSYTTRFNPRNINRSYNIQLSTDAIDHFILMPGQIFSFNKVVGIRSIQKGYRPARIIVKGEYSEGVGGGICQTSSTLFNSVDQAGLRIIQRVSHSKDVTYVPKHRDATVSWGGPDFKFQNQLNEPVIIVALIQNGQLNISVYGPKSTEYHQRYVPPSPTTAPASQLSANLEKIP